MRPKQSPDQNYSFEYDLNSAKYNLYLEIDPQIDTPYVDYIFPNSNSSSSSFFFWFTKIIVFFFILPLFLMRRVGQDYFFFEYMSCWIVLDWSRDLLLEFISTTFDVDGWMGWNLLIMIAVQVFVAFGLIWFFRAKLAPYFICKKISPRLA
jgi:hypothetical protein